MNRDDIIKWAREAGFTLFDEPNHLTECQMLDHFAALVAAEAAKAEREACAKVCDDFERAKWESVRNISENGGSLAFAGPMHCAKAIRARGETA